jgi:hypothetical protein
VRPATLNWRWDLGLVHADGPRQTGIVAFRGIGVKRNMSFIGRRDFVQVRERRCSPKGRGLGLERYWW